MDEFENDIREVITRHGYSDDDIEVTVVRKIKAKRTNSAMSAIERATGIYVTNPHLSIAEVAAKAGCSSSSLYKSDRFQQIYATLSTGDRPPPGSKSKGDIEAED